MMKNLDAINELLSTARSRDWQQALVLIRSVDDPQLTAAVLKGCKYVSDPKWHGWRRKRSAYLEVKKLHYYPTPAHVFLIANGLAHPQWTEVRARYWRCDARKILSEILRTDGTIGPDGDKHCWRPQPYLIEPVEAKLVSAHDGPILHAAEWEERAGVRWSHHTEAGKNCYACQDLACWHTVAEYEMSQFANFDIRLFGGSFWFCFSPDLRWHDLGRSWLIGLSKEQLFATAHLHEATSAAERVFEERSYGGFPQTQLAVVAREGVADGQPSRDRWRDMPRARAPKSQLGR
jgi:hypothetical protein